MSEVRVIAPDGKVGSIPAEDLERAAQEGYQVATPEALQAMRDEADYGGQEVRATLEGLARGATLGASDFAMTSLGLAEKHELLKRQQYTTGGRVGEVVGAIGTSVATGGLGTAGLAARGASVLARAGYMGAAGAIEGAVFGAAKAADDDFLNDHEITAERIALGAAEGAAFGGLAGAGASLAGSGLKAAGKKLAGELDLRQMAGESAYKAAVGRTNKNAIKLAERQGGASEVGNTLLEEGVPLTGDAESILAAVTTRADEVGEEIGNVIRQADELGSSVPTKTGVLEEVQKVIDNLKADPVKRDVGEAVERKLRGLFDDFTDPTKPNEISFEGLNNIRKSLDERLKWESGANPDVTLSAMRDVRRTINDYWMKAADDAAKAAGKPELVPALQSLKKRYAHLALARDQAQEAVVTQLANRATSLTDTLAGVGGAAASGNPVLGIIASQAHRFVRERGRGYLATALHRARVAAQKGEQQLDDAVGGLFTTAMRGARAAKRAFNASVPVAGVVLERNRKSYEQAVQHLAELQNPNSELRRRIREQNELSAESPDLANAAEQRLQRVADFLGGKAGPSAPDLTTPFARLTPKPFDKAHAMRLQRYADAAQKPQDALKRIAGGSASEEDVETLRELYPRLWSRFVTKSKARLADLKTPPSYRTQLALSRALGEPLTSFDSPEYQAALIPAAQAGVEAAQREQQSVQKLSQAADAMGAGSDRIAARR